MQENEIFERLARVISFQDNNIDKDELVGWICAEFEDRTDFNFVKFSNVALSDQRDENNSKPEQDAPTFMTLRHMAWERAKGELNSMLCTFWVDPKFEKTSRMVKTFIKFIENEGLAE